MLRCRWGGVVRGSATAFARPPHQVVVAAGDDEAPAGGPRARVHLLQSLGGEHAQLGAVPIEYAQRVVVARGAEARSAGGPGNGVHGVGVRGDGVEEHERGDVGLGGVSSTSDLRFWQIAIWVHDAEPGLQSTPSRRRGSLRSQNNRIRARCDSLQLQK